MAQFSIDFEGAIAPIMEAIRDTNKKIATIERIATSDAIAYSPSEVAAKLGVSRRVIDTSIKRGEIEARKFGRRVLIPRDSLLKWLNDLPLAG